ncbi:MAG: N-acetylmuramoyl-L-alanine amidase [candidate division WOR-3 bacterium]
MAERNGLRRLALAVGLALVAGATPALELAGAQIPVRKVGDVGYVGLYQVVQAYGGRYWRVNDRFVAVLPADTAAMWPEYVFMADSAVVLHDGRRITLTAAPFVEEGQLFIPALALTGLLPAPRVPVLRTIETARLGDTVSVTIAVGGVPAGETLGFRVETLSSLEYRLILGARCDSSFGRQAALISLTGGCGLLREVRIDSGAGTNLLFLFRRPAAGSAEVRNGQVKLLFRPRPERRIRKIVLDPGHGGPDPGAVGRQGTQEKAIVLDVAKRLKRRLEEKGFEVRLTRDSDVHVPLVERCRMANGLKPDLFISVHANAAPNREACGFEVYFLSEAKTDWDRAVAARENAAFAEELPDSSLAKDALGLILADLAQNEFLVESSELALAIQESAVRAGRVKDRGVRQANFHVLRNNYMPAVLVECGFLTNRTEEKLLRQGEHREKLARGIASGVIEFAQAYERRVNGR